MRPRRAGVSVVVLAVAAFALLIAPQFASAMEWVSETYVVNSGSVTYARVHGSNGFRLNFSENQKRYFEVRAVGDGTSTRYDLRGGPVEGGRVSADLGRRGKVELRFVPVGRGEKVGVVNWCSGSAGHWQPGYLVGRFRFRGERGYTEVRLHRIPAARETWSSLRCHYLEGGGGDSSPRRMSVGASRTVHGSHRSYEHFGATLFHRQARPSNRRVRFSAERWEGGQRISIGREATVEAKEVTFARIGGPKLPEEVEVSPPAPFSGSASFTRTAESTFNWRGDLAVDFPGLDPVRLTGKTFTVTVCKSEACVRRPAD